jgi:hypothetical protein
MAKPDGFPPESGVLESVSKGWPYILSSLKTYLERGSAIRLTEALRKERVE